MFWEVETVLPPEPPGQALLLTGQLNPIGLLLIQSGRSTETWDSLPSQLIQGISWQASRLGSLESVDMENCSWDSVSTPNGQMEKKVQWTCPKDNSNRKIFPCTWSKVIKLTSERRSQATSFVNAEMATRVTMAASR